MANPRMTAARHYTRRPIEPILRAASFCIICLATPRLAIAGMPAPLPTNVERVLQLKDSALFRFETISFFLVVFALCAAAVMALWNYLRRDFPALPRLSFGKAAAGVFLWGMLFIVVLTMISGARELMTPGAWEKQGFTYKLANPPSVTETAQANSR